MLHGSHEHTGDCQRERHYHPFNNRPAEPLENKMVSKVRGKQASLPFALAMEGSSQADGRCVMVAKAGVEEPRTVPKPEFQSWICLYMGKYP